MLYNTYTLYMI